MTAYLQVKTLRLVLVLFLVTFASFMMVNLLPGDAVDALLSNGESGLPSAEAREALMRRFDLDKPVIVRYGWWLAAFLQGDLGRSVITAQPVFDALVTRLPVSVELMLLAQIFALTLAIPLGILSAYRAGRALDRVISVGTFIILAAPVFVVAVSLIFLFSVELKLLPSAGFTPLSGGVGRNLYGLILPATAIGLAEIPVLVRVLRSDMVSTLQEDFIALAKAKGFSPAYILFRHALRPSSFTLITIVGLQMGSLVTGAVIVETIFGIPGAGKLLIEAIDRRDVVMVQGVVTVVAILYVLMNFAVDVLYALLDPRVARRTS